LSRRVGVSTIKLEIPNNLQKYEQGIAIMTTDLVRLFDLYSKFEKYVLHKRVNVCKVPDIECSTSVESGNGTLLSKVMGRYHKLLDNNSLSIRKRSNEILSNEPRHNADQLNGLQDTFKHMTNSLEQDPFRMAFNPLLKQDLDIGSIDTVPTTQLCSNILPKEGIYKTLVSHKEFELISSKSFYFNPRSGTLDGGVPMDGVSPTIILNHSIMTEYFNRMGFTPMSEDLISSHGIMWKALNHAVESLIKGFKLELSVYIYIYIYIYIYKEEEEFWVEKYQDIL
jgi:hypothetical protein